MGAEGFTRHSERMTHSGNSTEEKGSQNGCLFVGAPSMARSALTGAVAGQVLDGVRSTP